MASLSSFQHDKYSHLFKKFYDANKNGLITHSDFVQTVSDLKNFRGWEDGDERLAKCEETLNQAWLALKHGADLDKNQEVTMDEWFQYWADFIEKSAEAGGWPEDLPWVQDYMSFWFDILDTTGDGVVDEDEFTQVCTHFGMTDEESRAAYAKFSDKPVDKERFGELWLQFMTSDDPEDPGNHLFGHVVPEY